MTVSPWYKSHALWVAVLTAIGGILGAIFGPESAIVACVSISGAAIIGYFVSKGYIYASLARSSSQIRTAAGGEKSEINF